MSDQRIKGQEVAILIVRDSVLEESLDAIQSCNIEGEFEVKSVGYLGEKTNRKDDIFNGVKFDLECHLHNQLYFKFLKALKDRAMRNTPNVIFNISAVLNFPNGDTPVILIPDCKFGSNPIAIPARGDYVKVKLQGEASDYEISLP